MPKRKPNPDETLRSEDQLKKRQKTTLNREKRAYRRKDIKTKAIKQKWTSSLTPAAQTKLQPVVEGMVSAFSRWAHEACIFANGVVLLALEVETFSVPEPTQQFFNDCLRAVRGFQTTNPLVNHFLLTEWTPSGFDYHTHLKGLAVPGQNLARRLATNALTHLWYPFRGRQFLALVHQTDGDKDQARKLQKIINENRDFTDDADLKDLQGIMTEHKEYLCNPLHEEVSDEWLQQHPREIIRYYQYLLRIQERALAAKSLLPDDEKKTIPKVKTFSYLPIQGYGLACVEIQTMGLHALMRKAKMTTYTQKEFGARQHEMWQSVLNIPMRRGPWQFNYSLQTDSVQVSLMYWKYQPGHDSQFWAVDLKDHQKGLWTDQQVLEGLKGHRVIGVDPGRNQLLFTSKNGLRLSKNQYYEECGYNVVRQRALHHRYQQPPDVRKRLDEAAHQTFRVSALSCWKAHWSARRPLEDTLFKFYGDRRYRNHRFYTYKRKQQCLSRFMSRLSEGVPQHKVVIALGNGRFPTSSRGERGGPLKYLAKQMAHHFKVVYTDEFRTSITCSHCQGRMEKAPIQTFQRDPETNLFRSVKAPCHEILRCQKCLVWRNRDRNAAENIRNLLVLTLKGQPKPRVFQRGTKTHEVYGPQMVNVPTPASFWTRFQKLLLHHPYPEKPAG